MSTFAPNMSTPSAIELWKRFHWAFFVNTQGLLMALSRFERFVETEDFEGARREMAAAATLMRASGASMQLAGSFTRQEYKDQVRPSMMPPELEVAGFSGLMSWDHASLIELWRRLSPIFASLPDVLEHEYEDFVAAYGTLADSHSAVCSRFVAKGEGSIRYEGDEAIESLSRFRKGREAMIAPQGRVSGCPAHGAPATHRDEADDDIES